MVRDSRHSSAYLFGAICPDAVDLRIFAGINESGLLRSILAGGGVRYIVGMIDEASIKSRFEAIRDRLDERGRRLFGAAEVRAAGYGGLAAVSRATGLARSTLGRGLKELSEPPLPANRIRRRGGGRMRLTVKSSTLLDDLRRLVEPVTLGDLRCLSAASPSEAERAAFADVPIRPLLWVSKSRDKLAMALCSMGHKVSASSIRKLLLQLGYSRQANRKANDGSHHIDLRRV
jgi:DNA-binding phage protein